MEAVLFPKIMYLIDKIKIGNLVIIYGEGRKRFDKIDFVVSNIEEVKNGWIKEIFWQYKIWYNQWF